MNETFYILSKDSGEMRPHKEFVYACRGDDRILIGWGGQADPLTLKECMEFIMSCDITERFHLQRVTWL